MVKEKNRHKYSTYTLLVFLALLIIAAIGSALSSEDVDILCNTTDAILKRTSTGWDCSVTNYGEMYFHNVSSPNTISIASVGVYYPIGGLTNSNLEGITTDGMNMTIAKNGTYSIVFTASFRGGNTGQYETEIFVNGIEQMDCAFHRSTSSTSVGDATISCLKALTNGQVVSVRIEDQSAPAQDALFEVINFKIVEVQ